MVLSPPPTVAYPCPKHTEIDPLSPLKVACPEYLCLYQQDQLMISNLMSTISESLLHITIACDTSRALWDCLQ